MNGRVAVLRAYGGEFELREYPVPDVEPGAILVRLTRAGICGSDLHIWRGEMKEVYGAMPSDLTFGHEMCGRVERLEPGVATDSMGQPLPAGAGGIGINAVAVARDMGADTVIVIDRLPERLALARAFGADHTLSTAELTTAEQRVEAARELTGGFGADVVADFVGYPDVIPEGLRMLRGGGCYLEVGSIAPGNVFSYDATALVRGNARLVATSNYSPWAPDQALPFLRRHLRRFPFERVVSHVFPLERISEGFRQADWMQRQGDPVRISRAAVSM